MYAMKSLQTVRRIKTELWDRSETDRTYFM